MEAGNRISKYIRQFSKQCLLLSSAAMLLSSSTLLYADSCTPFEPGQYSSSLALDPTGNPHIAWEQVLDSWETASEDCQQNDIYYTHSNDEGASFFAATAEIDRLPITQARVSLAVDQNGNPAVAWVDTRDEQKSIYFARSLDGGDTFLPGVRVDPSPRRQERPALALDSSGNPVIAWIMTYHQAPYQNPVGYVYVTRSDDGGATFLPSVCVCGNSKPRPYMGWPSLAIDSQDNPMVVLHYYATWNKSWNAYLVKSLDQGASFEKPVWIEKSSYHQYVSGNNAFGIDANDNPYVMMTDNRTGDWNIRLARSTDGGQTFLPSVPIDPNGAIQMTPSLSIDASSNLYVAWADKRSGPNHIRFAKSEDGGTTFQGSFPVDSSEFLQNRPCLAVDSSSGVIHLTWSDERQGRLYVYYTKSIDGGQSFLPSIPVYEFPVD